MADDLRERAEKLVNDWLAIDNEDYDALIVRFAEALRAVQREAIEAAAVIAALHPCLADSMGYGLQIAADIRALLPPTPKGDAG